MRNTYHWSLYLIASGLISCIIIALFIYTYEETTPLTPSVVEKRIMMDSMKYEDVVLLFQNQQKEDVKINNELFVNEFPADPNFYIVLGASTKDLQRTLLVKFWDKRSGTSTDTFMHFNSQYPDSIGYWLYHAVLSNLYFNVWHEQHHKEYGSHSDENLLKF